jgi:DNA-binding SARP family transcriptional activator/tetratricopeptide (TPR) repeat protein
MGAEVVAFRILGPVRLYQQERAVDLGPTKIRGLLGILLLSANIPVPIDSIVDRLWDNPSEQDSGSVRGREPPPTPHKTLQVYVSKLRAALIRTAAPAKLLTEHRRYRLQINPTMIDYQCFRGLAAKGQRAFRAGDHLSATSSLSEAVELWRGQPLADVHSSWAQRTADAMAFQDLLPAYHSLFGAHLALGHAEYVLEQLRPLLAVYETDLTLIELQMRALAEVNGRSSLVSYFHDVADNLRKVLSIDPTDQLAQLYHRLIEQPSGVELPQQPVRVGTTRRPLLFHLPRDIPHLIGRTEILRELDERLTASHVDPVVALDGAPGVGKTALATYWAHRRRDQFPDGVLYADLNGYGPGHPVAPATVLATFLTALGLPLEHLPGDLTGRTALLQQELAGRRVLIVLDNAYDSAHVTPLLAATSPCPVLVTSRQKLSLLAYNDGAHSITVPTLLLDESIALLQRSIRGTRVQQDMATLQDFATLCAGLPIALRIVGEHVAVRADVPLQELVQHLRRRHLLDAGSHGDRGSRTLRAAFDLSVDKFSPDIARFFGLLGLYPATDITTEVAAAVSGLSLAETEQAFDVLVGAHLVHQLSADSYRIHDLLHLYAEDRAGQQGPPEIRHQAIHRMVDWYLYSGLNAARLLAPQDPTVPPLDEAMTIAPRIFDNADEARRWFLAERTKIIAVSQRAAEAGMHDHQWRLVGTFSDLLNCYCDPVEIIDVHRQAVVSAQIDGARDGESGNLNSLGVIEFNRHDYESAARYFTQALAIFREIDDEYGESISLYNIGNTHLERGQTRRAIEFHERSLVISERIGDKAGQASVYHRLGEAYQRSGQHDTAVKFYQKSLRTRAEIADLRGQAGTLAKLGELSLERGDPQAAIGYCEKAGAIGDQIFDRRGVAETLHTKAVAYVALADFGGVSTSSQEAARLCRMMNDFGGEARAMDLSAEAQQALGDYVLAERHWRTALELYDRLGDPRASDVRDKLDRLRELSSELTTQRLTSPIRRKRLVPTKRRNELFPPAPEQR